MRRAAVVVLVVLAFTGCGGGGRYAGLSRPEAVKTAKTAVEAPLDPTKRPYYETSIGNVAADYAADAQGRPAWLVGIWNGQTSSGDCALAARRDGSTIATVVPCASFPLFAR